MGRKVELDEDAFRVAWADGDRLTDMAQRFGLTSSGISLRAKRLGLTQRRPGNRPPDDEAIREQWTAGVTVADIAVALHCTPATVTAAATRLGLTRRRGRPRAGIALDGGSWVSNGSTMVWKAD